MLILAFDTTAESVSVALLSDDKVIASDCQTMTRGHGEALIPMIQNLMKPIANMSELDAVAVTVGAGSFTGVRVGLATARGIGLSLKIPVFGVTTFQVGAYGHDEKVIVALDTKRGDFYTQIFENQIPIEQPKIRTLSEIKSLKCPCVGLGDCPAVKVGLTAYKNKENPLSPEPLYLRDADVSC